MHEEQNSVINPTDPEDDDIDLWMPVPFETRQCSHCKTYIVEERKEDAYWVIENPADGFYTPYCNEFHYQAHHKVGLWADQTIAPALDLDS